jgi:hypothetical protein
VKLIFQQESLFQEYVKHCEIDILTIDNACKQIIINSNEIMNYFNLNEGFKTISILTEDTL